MGAEEDGREYFETKDGWYKLKTIVCRIFGVTPIRSSHEQRLIDLESAISKCIEKGHNFELYIRSMGSPFLLGMSI